MREGDQRALYRQDVLTTGLMEILTGAYCGDSGASGREETEQELLRWSREVELVKLGASGSRLSQSRRRQLQIRVDG